MAKNAYHIQPNRRTQKQIIEKMASPCVYRPEDYGLSPSLTGKGVKIAILDSGAPDHPDIVSTKESIDMSESSKDCLDHNGHSTMVSGIISSKNSNAITGISPDAELYFAKVVNTDGECLFNSLVAGVLWAVIKKVDIILISMGSPSNFPVLHDAIKKAYNQNISIFSAAGNGGQTDFPAAYPEVLSISKRTSGRASKFLSTDNCGIEIVVPDTSFYTTYLHGKYTKAGGTSLTAAITAGLASLIIEKNRDKSGSVPTPNTIYSELANLSYKPVK